MTPSRILAALGLALALALLALLLLFRGGAPENVPVAGEQRPEPTGERTLPPPAGEPGDAPPARELAVEEPAAFPAHEDEGPSCRVFGRVVDEGGLPLAGVAVTLYSAEGPWAADREEPRTEFRGHEIVGYATETDADGHFELETMLPTSSWMELAIEPDHLHGLDGRDFGLPGGRDWDPIAEGDNDLGTIVLPARGAIAGVVRSARGGPLTSASVRADGSSGHFHLSAGCDESGRFLIGHLGPGRYTVSAQADGYLTEQRTDVAVEVGSVSEGIDLALEPAPRVAGLVIDQDGLPIADVQLLGRAARYGGETRTRTDADGRFEVYLLLDEPYVFQLWSEGYESIDEHRLTPGETDARIVMVPAVMTTFIVVDARTGDPVERFGLRIGPRPTNRWSHWVVDTEVPLRDVIDGLLTLPAEPWEDAYSIQAPGHGPQFEAVRHETDDTSRQVIRLRPEGRIRGRVTFDGVPFSRAIVRVDRGQLLDGAPHRPRPHGFDLDAYTGRLRTLITGDDGSFELGELAAGTYRVQVTASVGAPLTLVELRVAAGETLDLGELAIGAGATLRGRVLVGSALVPTGLTLSIDEEWGMMSARTEAGGTFSFEGLPPGDVMLFVDDLPGLVLDAEPAVFTLAEGETRDVVLDFGPWQPCTVRVRVVDDDGPARDTLVTAWLDRGGTPMGSTDEDGWVEMECPASDEASFEVHSAARLLLAAASAAVALPPGGQVDVQVPVHRGQLSLAFPTGFELSADERALVVVESAVDVEDRGGGVVVACGQDPLSGHGWVLDGTECDLGMFPVGEFVVEVSVALWDRDPGDRAATEILAGRVSIQAGRRATCVLVRK